MSKNRVKLISDTDAEQLQLAGDRVSELTLQGYHPTEAIAKVASANRFPLHKTELLIYAYNNGVAAEKRASAGGPFERLQEFSVPDPVRVKELVYGAPSAEDTSEPDLFGRTAKTASLDSLTEFLPQGMATFDTDISGLSFEDARKALGIPSPSVKTASDGDKDGEDEDGQGFSVSRTTISFSMCPSCDKEKKTKDARFVHKIPETIKEQIEAGFKMMSPELNRDIDSSLLRLMGVKEAEMHLACGVADEAYAHLGDLTDTMADNIRSRRLSPSFKAAGLVSVNAFYPDIAAMLAPQVSEVDAYLMKTAVYSPTDVSANHPWIADAKRLWESMEKTAELTAAANKCTEEYKAVRDLYYNRPRYKAADWRVFAADDPTQQKTALIGPADALSGAHILGQAQDWLTGFVAETPRDVTAKKKIEQQVRNDLDDPSHEIALRNIGIQNMLSDFSANDEILSAFPMRDLLRGYSDLLHTAPQTMRNRAQARALLQQYMTQGRMAPTELIPALQMNKLTAERPSDKDPESAVPGGKV
jgi:hypothetical protein